MNPFYIGEPTPPDRLERLLCGRVSTLPEQDGETCEKRADLHVLVRHPKRGTLHKLLTCLGHYPAAVEAGEEVVTHEIGLWCGLPNTHFDPDQNVCEVDDSGVEPSQPEEQP